MGTTQALHVAVGRRAVNQSGGTRTSTPKRKFSAQIDVSLREDLSVVSLNSGCVSKKRTQLPRPSSQNSQFSLGFVAHSALTDAVFTDAACRHSRRRARRRWEYSLHPLPFLMFLRSFMAVKDSNLVATNYENMGLGEDTPSALLPVTTLSPLHPPFTSECLRTTPPSTS